ncbi:MAG: YdcF family protein [Patescibacteria group bacterium]
MTEAEILAEKIWDYHHMNQKLEKADCILVLGSHDERVAQYASKLFLEGWASLIIFSGGLGRLTKGLWDKPEGDRFAEIAMSMGVPQNKIIIENKSTNTQANILFTKKLIEEKGIDPRKFIVVQKPYMERRAYATFKRNWPEKEVIVTSPPIPFEEYPDHLRSREDVINIMVGDLQRIKLYAEKGFQIPQEVPTDVWEAYERLIELGYTKQMIPAK